MKRSVALTTCNSVAFLEELLHSVLEQLSSEDEVVISADPSNDGTQALLASYAENDKRIRLIEGPGNGPVANFSNAVSHCGGDIIFLCDHDDVWLPGKVEKVSACFENPEVMAVIHDAKVCDGELHVTAESYMAWHGSKEGYWQNIWRNSFIGCCMAFRGEMKGWVLPFPDDIPMHDQWIGLLSYRHGLVRFLREPLLLYRRHGGNVSSTEHASLPQMLKWRLRLLKNLSKQK